MTIYSWKSAQSGSWNVASNWNPPGGPQIIGFPSGPSYSPDTGLFATGSKKPYTVNGSGAAGDLEVSGDRVIFRAFSFSSGSGGFYGSGFTVENHAVVTVAGDSSIQVGGYHVIPSGNVAVDDATLIVEGRVTSVFGSVTAGGHVIVSGPYASLSVVSGLSGVGDLTVDATSSVSVINGAGFSDYGPDIAGKVNVIGAGSNITLQASYTGTGLAAFGGSLSICEIDGNVTLADGTLSVGTVAASAKVTGSGTIASPFSNSGFISAQGGTLTLEGAVSGPGTLGIGAYATLLLDAATAETITFTGLDARLQLAPNITATGFLDGFRAGDSLDIRGTNITRVSASQSGPDTVLKAYAGTTLVDTFTIGGPIATDGVSVTSDHGGGSLLYLLPTGGLHCMFVSLSHHTA